MASERTDLASIIETTLAFFRTAWAATTGYASDVGSWLAKAFSGPMWELMSSKYPENGNIFGFAEFIASVALLLVVFTAADFRYRLRLSLYQINLRKFGALLVGVSGFLILLVDTWYQNKLPVPRILENANNIKAIIGLIFLAFVTRLIWVATVRPPYFGRRNSGRYREVVLFYLHQGDPDRLLAVAEELTRSSETILEAANASNSKKKDIKEHQLFAKHIILALADRRFCTTIVAKFPGFAIEIFRYIQEKALYNVPAGQFARNIANAFIRNNQSAFYQEDGYYSTGLFGQQQPITNILFGHYEFVEFCAGLGTSPLDTSDWRSPLTPEQWSGYGRAAQAFFNARQLSSNSRSRTHSYALNQLQQVWEHVFLDDVGLNELRNSDQFAKFQTSVLFVRECIRSLEKSGKRALYFRSEQNGTEGDDFEFLANIAYSNIFNSTSVCTDEAACWHVLYSKAWTGQFGYSPSEQAKDVARKLRRLIYNQIKGIEGHANFVSARLLGYCLLVFGFEKSRISGDELCEPIRRVAVKLAVRNYERMRRNQPHVADAILMGPLSYDADGRRFVRTYAGRLGVEPNRAYLPVNPYEPDQVAGR